MDPTVSQALSRGASAVSRSGWLAAVGLLVTLLRTAVFLPVQLFAIVMLQLAAASWLASHAALPVPQLAARGVELVLGAPRFVSIVVGLWLVGALTAAALRVAYLAGALPTIGAELARAPRQHRFAAGFARGFSALLPAASIAFLLELASGGAAAALLACAALAAARLFAAHHGALGAASAALGIASSLLLAASTSMLCDAAICRTALRGEPATLAFARAAIRFGARPAAFLAVGIAATALGAVAAVSVEALAALGAGATASRTSPWPAIGPQAVAAALAAFTAALVDLWRLASTAVLACHDR